MLIVMIISAKTSTTQNSHKAVSLVPLGLSLPRLFTAGIYLDFLCDNQPFVAGYQGLYILYQKY